MPSGTRSRSKSPARSKQRGGGHDDTGSKALAAKPEGSDEALKRWQRIKEEHGIALNREAQGKTLPQRLRNMVEPTWITVYSLLTRVPHWITPLLVLLLLTVYDDIHNCAMRSWYTFDGKLSIGLGICFALLVCYTWKGMIDEFYDTKGEIASGILLVTTVRRIIEPAMRWMSSLDDQYCNVKNSTQVTKEDYWCSREWCDISTDAKESCTEMPTPSVDAICTMAVLWFALRELWKVGAYHLFSEEEAAEQGLSHIIFDIIDADNSGHVSKEEMEVWLALDPKEQQKLIKANKAH